MTLKDELLYLLATVSGVPGQANKRNDRAISTRNPREFIQLGSGIQAVVFQACVD
ncbi:hypothetical protein GCM10023264_04940 [Sphingomonas daechungensis]|nr:hypothetical protein [Sphingomonas daechungensis]